MNNGVRKIEKTNIAKSTRDLALASTYLSVIIALELLLAPIPNVQLTFPLIVLFVNSRSLKSSMLLIVAYSLIKSLIWGFTIFSLIGLLAWLTTMFFKFFRITNIGIFIISFALMWVYAGFTIYLYSIPASGYIAADFPFTLLFAINNIITINIIKTPIGNLLNALKKQDC